MSRSRRNIRSAPALALTGSCLYLAMPPMSLYAIAWIALVPLLMRWRQLASPRQAWLEAATAFFVLYAFSGHWIVRHPSWESAVASLGAAVLLPLLQGVPFAAALPFRRRYGPTAGFGALAIFSLSVEWLLLHGPAPLPWFLLGHTQADALLFNQFVDLTGVLGLSLWVWLINGSAWAALTWRRFWRFVPLVTAFGLLIGAYLYSDYRRAHLTSNEYRRVAVAQPALSAQTWADGPPRRRIKQLSRLSDSLLHSLSRPPQLMIWPETALPPIEQDAYTKRLFRDLQEWTRQNEMPLLAGAVRYARANVRTSTRPTRPFNSAILISGETTDRYDKRQLVPFAEGVPGAPYWEFLARLAINSGGISGYRVGQTSGLLAADSIAFAAQICFESLFGYLHRRAVQDGAGFIVVLAQNGWWGESAAPAQHRAFTRLRAMESRRSLVMATVSGGSGLIHADGSFGKQLGWMTPRAALLRVPVHRGQTFYVRYGDWPGVAALLVAAGLAALHLSRRKWMGC